MTVVVWRDIRVRVRVAGPSIQAVDEAYEEIVRDVTRVAKAKKLTKRHRLEAHDVYGVVQETLQKYG